MMMLFSISAKEGRYVAVTCALLHMDMDQDMHMLLEGTLAKFIVKFEPGLD